MSDLTAKFEAFEQQSATQHTQLMAALGTLGGKLDAIAVALGGAPPTASITLADLYAAILAGNTILGDVHTDTMSMDGKLLTVRNTLSDVHLDTQSQDLKLLQIRDILSGMDDYLSIPNPVIAQIYASLGAVLGGDLASVKAYLASIATSDAGLLTVLGNPADDTKSILRWIEDIAACACADPNAVPRLDDCSAPFASTGIVLTPFSFVGFSDVAVAVWTGPLPAGISWGTTLGVEEDHTALYSDDWSGWRLYVQSSEFNAAYTPTSADRYPTNTWQQFPGGPAEYSFAVRGQGNIKVILCPTDPAAAICDLFAAPGFSENLKISVSGSVTVTYHEGAAPGIGIYLFNDETYTGENYNLTTVGQSASFTHTGIVALTSGAYPGAAQVEVCCAGTGPHYISG